jgi:PhzF family phenazine biosynthesis protein
MRIRVVDAFTDRPFAGNPAAVCLLTGDRWPDETWMQAVAAEMNLSETAFAHPLTDRTSADWGLRWFTPTVEVDLCGHATLATAHVLHTDGAAPDAVRFASRSGVLVTHAAPDGRLTLDFPAAPVEATPAPDGLAAALGAEPTATFGTGVLGDLLAVLPDEAAVRGLAPDLPALADLSRRAHLRGVIVTAPAAGDGHDFVSRFFAPAVGVAEDPVTGSAHTALAPYWSARLGRDTLVGRQVSARGGLVHTEVRGDRVHLSGHAVTVLDGTLQAGSAQGS